MLPNSKFFSEVIDYSFPSSEQNPLISIQLEPDWHLTYTAISLCIITHSTPIKLRRSAFNQQT